MSTSQYTLYKRQNFKLARTLVIKLEEISQTINQELQLAGYPIVDQELVNAYPYSHKEMFHKYYQNLGGIYHISDQMKLQDTTGHPFLQIKLATNNGYEWVDFTRQLLEYDPAVANEYQYDSYYYKQLVERYPEYESLILGILHPVDIDIAVKARNGEILFCGGYAKSYITIDGEKEGEVIVTDETHYRPSVNGLGHGLVEPQELNLIPELQKWIDKYLFRWTNAAYSLTDDLYTAASLAIMYCQIPMALMNIRLENCHTSMAHTFHVKQYLDTHGGLGHTVDTLPLESIMWLYRNARYYETNLGKQLTLDALVENVFTPSRIPLAGYETSHDVSIMPQYVLPKPELFRVPLNFDSVGSTRADKTVKTILEENVDAARLNEKELEDAELKISNAIRYSGDDTLPTKLLESEIIPIINQYPFTITHVLMNMWLYAIEENDTTNKSFSGFVFATNPVTGSRMVLTPRNAYKLAMYCLNKGYFGIELKRPISGNSIKTRNIPRSKEYVPTPEHSLKPTPTQQWGYTNFSKAENVMAVYGDLSIKRHYKSTEHFNEEASKVFVEMARQYDHITSMENVFERAELEHVMNRMYWGEIPCKLDMEDTYEEWFEKVGVDIEGLNEVNLINLGLELVSNSTGLELSLTKKTEQIQAAALDVLRHFASYTVLIMDSQGGDTGFNCDLKMSRLSDIKTKLTGLIGGNVSVSLDYNLTAHERLGIIYETFGEEIAFVSFERVMGYYDADIPTLDFGQPEVNYHERVQLPMVGVLNAMIDIPEFYDRDIPPPPEKRASDKFYYKSDPYETDD